MTTITLSPEKSAPIESRLLLGAAIDGHQRGDTAKIFTPANLRAMRSVGLGPLSYRLRTELGSEAWHWSRGGRWSESGRHEGYWTGDGRGADGITNGYRLPRRGNTFDQAENHDYSRIDDGDPATFWKSNPYLDEHFTHEPNALHPQWLLVDLGKAQPVDSLRVRWGPVRPQAFTLEYWPTGSPLFYSDVDPNALRTPEKVTVDWQRLGSGRVTGSQSRLAVGAKRVRYLRLVFSGSSYRGPATTDIRDRVGVSVRELYAYGGGSDLLAHRKDNTQTPIYTSSSDPWHRASDRDPSYEQPPLARIAKGPLNHGPMLVPSPVYYDTPDNARAWFAYLKRTRIPIRGIELGEEPDSQLVAPEDYAALYLQVAAEAKRANPAWPTGGPSFGAYYPDWIFWLDAHHDQSWTHRLIGYLKGRRAFGLFNFFSFEWYPVDDTCAEALPRLQAEPRMLKTLVERQKANGVPVSIPWVLAEYGYSSYSGAPEVDLPGAILTADVVGQMSTLVPHAQAYFYGYEPVPLISESRRCDSFGNLTVFVSDAAHHIRYRVPAYWAIHLLARQWAERAPTTPLRSPQTPQLTSYALLHRDGSVSAILLNKDSRARRVRLELAHGAGATKLVGLQGWQYSPANYRFQQAGAHGHPSLNRPPTAFSARGQITLPPLSLTVVRSRP